MFGRSIFQDRNKRITIAVNFGEAYVTPEGESIWPLDYIVRKEFL